MKKILALATTASFVLVGATAAQAKFMDMDFSHPYLRLDSGWSWNRQSDLGSALIAGAGLGYQFNEFRADITGTYRGNYDIKGTQSLGGTPAAFDSNGRSIAALLNVYYDFSRWWMVKPYIGAGIGIAWNHLDSVHYTSGGTTADLPSNNNTSLAWQGSAGVTFDIDHNVALDVGYRFVDLGRFRTRGGPITVGGATVGEFSGDGKVHEATAALRFKL